MKRKRQRIRFKFKAFNSQRVAIDGQLVKVVKVRRIKRLTIRLIRASWILMEMMDLGQVCQSNRCTLCSY